MLKYVKKFENKWPVLLPTLPTHQNSPSAEVRFVFPLLAHTSRTFSLRIPTNLLGEQTVAGNQPFVLLLTLRNVNAVNKLKSAKLS